MQSRPQAAPLCPSGRGAAAEARAAQYLERRGGVVLARNLACKYGELDIVCLDGEVLAIVEVRLRLRPDFGGAAGSVTRRKQQKLIRATQYHWQRRPEWRTRRVRFDVIAIQGKSVGNPGITWIKDAFRS